MTAPPARNELWDAHVERVRELHPRASAGVSRPGRRRPQLDEREAAEARRREAAAPPPGRLGRLLLDEVDRYLAFFAVAHDA